MKKERESGISSMNKDIRERKADCILHFVLNVLHGRKLTFKAYRLLYVPPVLKFKKFHMLITFHLCVLCSSQNREYL